MNIQLEFWHLVTLLLAFFGFVAGGAKVLFDQINRRLDERFTAMEQARQAADKAMQDEQARHAREMEKAVAKSDTLGRELSQLREGLPMHYTRREDYVHNQVILEAKIDRVFEKLENLQLQRRNQ